MTKLLEKSLDTDAIALAGNDIEIVKLLISLMTTNEFATKAASLIGKFRFTPQTLPSYGAVVERLDKKCIRYWKKNVSIDRLEEKFMGRKKLLGYIVEDLVNESLKTKKNLEEVISVAIRHKLVEEGYINADKKETWAVLQAALADSNFHLKENQLFALDDYGIAFEACLFSVVITSVFRTNGRTAWFGFKRHLYQLEGLRSRLRNQCPLR